MDKAKTDQLVDELARELVKSASIKADEWLQAGSSLKEINTILVIGAAHGVARIMTIACTGHTNPNEFLAVAMDKFGGLVESHLAVCASEKVLADAAKVEAQGIH